MRIQRYLPKEDEDNCSSFMKSLLYNMLKLQQRRYRRFNGNIYRPIYNSQGYYTNAWEINEMHRTIEDFVWSSVDPDRQWHIFHVFFFNY